jgi:hypothetical protein
MHVRRLVSCGLYLVRLGKAGIEAEALAVQMVDLDTLPRVPLAGRNAGLLDT